MRGRREAEDAGAEVLQPLDCATRPRINQGSRHPEGEECSPFARESAVGFHFPQMCTLARQTGFSD